MHTNATYRLLRARAAGRPRRPAAWSPADLPGLAGYDFTSGLYQDSGGVTPAAVGDPVRRAVHPLTGDVWTAPSDGARGTARAGGLEFGTNKYMTPAADVVLDGDFTAYLVGAVHGYGWYPLEGDSLAGMFFFNGYNWYSAPDGFTGFAVAAPGATDAGRPPFGRTLVVARRTGTSLSVRRTQTPVEMTGTLSGTLTLDQVAIWNGQYDGAADSRYLAAYVYPAHYAHGSAEDVQILAWLRANRGATLYPDVVVAGNSLATGYGASTDFTTPPGYVSGELGPAASVCDAALAGATTGYLVGQDVTRVDPLVDAAATTTQVLFFWEIRNDLCIQLSTKETALANAQEYADDRTAAGWSVILGTCIDSQLASGAGDEPADFNTSRTFINDALGDDFTVSTADPYVWLAGPGVTYAAALIRFDQMSEFSDATDTDYYQADKVHLTDAANAIVAAKVAYARGLLVA